MLEKPFSNVNLNIGSELNILYLALLYPAIKTLITYPRKCKTEMQRREALSSFRMVSD